MKRHAAGMTIAVLHAIVLSACAAQPERTEPAASNAPPLTARDQPLQDARSAADLLHNMRAVLVRGSLAHRSFFSDVQLKATFGGSSIEWIRNTLTNVNCHLGPIDSLPVRSREPGLPRISFLWYDASPGERDKPAGNFSTWCACELTSTDIDALNWKKRRHEWGLLQGLWRTRYVQRSCTLRGREEQSRVTKLPRGLPLQSIHKPEGAVLLIESENHTVGCLLGQQQMLEPDLLPVLVPGRHPADRPA